MDKYKYAGTKTTLSKVFRDFVVSPRISYNFSMSTSSVPKTSWFSVSVQLARSPWEREKKTQESCGACVVTDDGRRPLFDRSSFLWPSRHVRQWLRYLGWRESWAFLQDLDVRRYVQYQYKNLSWYLLKRENNSRYSSYLLILKNEHYSSRKNDTLNFYINSLLRN